MAHARRGAARQCGPVEGGVRIGDGCARDTAGAVVLALAAVGSPPVRAHLRVRAPEGLIDRSGHRPLVVDLARRLDVSTQILCRQHGERHEPQPVQPLAVALGDRKGDGDDKGVDDERREEGALARQVHARPIAIVAADVDDRVGEGEKHEPQKPLMRRQLAQRVRSSSLRKSGKFCQAAYASMAAEPSVRTTGPTPGAATSRTPLRHVARRKKQGPVSSTLRMTIAFSACCEAMSVVGAATKMAAYATVGGLIYTKTIERSRQTAAIGRTLRCSATRMRSESGVSPSGCGAPGGGAISASSRSTACSVVLTSVASVSSACDEEVTVLGGYPVQLGLGGTWFEDSDGRRIRDDARRRGVDVGRRDQQPLPVANSLHPHLHQLRVCEAREKGEHLDLRASLCCIAKPQVEGVLIPAQVQRVEPLGDGIRPRLERAGPALHVL